MQIEKTFVVNAPAPAVWEFLTDPHKVARCLPGAAVTDKLDDQAWAGTMTVKVGPVTASYRGKMRFERLDAAAGEAEIVASGQETRGKGGADMRMKSRVTARPEGGTEVTVVSDVNVVGVLAQLGRGMIQDVSDQLFRKFSEAMRRELEAPAAALTPDPSPAPPSALAGRGEPPHDSGVAVPPSPREGGGGVGEGGQGGEGSRSPAPVEPALDLGSLGAAAVGRAAGRSLRRPGFWIAVILIAALVFWFLRSLS